MKKHLVLVASLLFLVLGSGALSFAWEGIATAAELLPLDADLDPSIFLSADPAVAPADAELFVGDETPVAFDDAAPDAASPAGDSPDTAVPDFEQALLQPLSDSGLGAPPALPADAPGWPYTTAETTLASPVGRPPTSGSWVDINLSRQTATVYRGSTPIKTVLVSTGTYRHPTVTGLFRVWARVRSQTMSGGRGREYYRLPGVPHVQYFFRGYALHGTYWHRNFGRRMSHGCVNLTFADAAFFWSYGYVGMPVRSHY